MQDTKTQSGFTLIETLVAVSILLLAITAPLTLGSQGLTASRVARDQVTATLLAQEAIEYVRNIRDTNALNGDAWLTDLDACVGSPCALDVPNNSIDNSNCLGKSASCPALTFDSDHGFYGLTPVTKNGVVQTTKFSRDFTITETGSTEARLEATVSWADGLITRSVTVNDYIYDWQ